jgi:hypothetical protein
LHRQAGRVKQGAAFSIAPAESIRLAERRSGAVKTMVEGGREDLTLDVAIHRLDRALGQLELRVAALANEVVSANNGLFDQDRAKLAAELDACRSRERELEVAGSLASQALGRAIADIRAVLGEEA